jgi:hypothetical protein
MRQNAVGSGEGLVLGGLLLEKDAKTAAYETAKYVAVG